MSAAAVLAIATVSAVAESAIRPVLIRNVHVFDGEHASQHRSVLIEGGKISRIGASDLEEARAEVIDGRGLTLLPGLIDAHVHIGANVEDCLRQALSFGITTELDMFTSLDRLKRLKQVEADDSWDMADVRTAGIGATAPGGHPTQLGGPPVPTITGPEQAQSFVDARLAEGSDYIKLIHDNLTWALGAGKRLPTLNNETLRALVKAAHERGKLAIVHIGSEQDARDAIEAGVDGLAHMFTGESASPDFGSFAAQHHVFVIPTLSNLYSCCGQPNGAALLSDPQLKPYLRPEWQRSLTVPWPLLKPSCSGTRDGIRELLAAHVPILAGTDAAVPGTTYGVSLHGELDLLVEAGLRPTQALAAATSVPARTFKLSDRGFIRPGMRADLILVQGDPTQNIDATRNIVAVFKKGVRVQRKAADN